MRATERQRGSGYPLRGQNTAWPGNAITACVAGERNERHQRLTTVPAAVVSTIQPSA